MDHIRPFSIEKSKQDEFVQSIPKMIQDFLNELPRVEASKLAEDGQCMICHQKYGLENPDADTIEEAEGAVCFPCGHHAGRKCISTWLQTSGDSCPLCRKKFFLVVPWPHIIPDEKDREDLKYHPPDFEDICSSLRRSDYILENVRTGLRGRSLPGWIVRAAGNYYEYNESQGNFFRDHEFRKMVARKILSTSPSEVENAPWMLQVYPRPGDLEAHVEALASALGAALPRSVIYIQLRDRGATIYQVNTYTDSEKPYQDEGFFRNLISRGGLDGDPLMTDDRRGSWWTYLGDGNEFSTYFMGYWRVWRTRSRIRVRIRQWIPWRDR
ncbi:hypothetical protein HO173_006319 [Letharia columbiana]|uniref:RING-type domain-containing protein n=1 Tax=Letharia columbiana TaxID=112416 RepID=A0A8H6FVT6_9LECA|nr:uncharacterized protein HO173_006319 [Letharia columbiana]KAF6235636.1 hypothetical protein HO173_006319 [Letharia columbiana]